MALHHKLYILIFAFVSLTCVVSIVPGYYNVTDNTELENFIEIFNDYEDESPQESHMEKVQDLKLRTANLISQVLGLTWAQPLMEVGHDMSAKGLNIERLSNLDLENGFSDSRIQSPLDEIFSRQMIPKDANEVSLSVEDFASLFMNVSSQCQRDLMYTLVNIGNIGGWASKMIDSMGKPPSGIFEGNFLWIGSYKECVDAKAPQFAVNVSNTSYVFGDFIGQYCLSSWLLQVSKTVNIPVTVGLCLPSSCKNDAIQKEASTLWKIIGGSSFLKRKMESVSFNSVTCKSHSIPWEAADIVVLTLYSLMGALLVIGTSYDVILKTVFEKTKQKLYSTGKPDQADSFIQYSDSTPDQTASESNSSVPHPVDFSNLGCDNIINTLCAESENSISKQAATLDSNQHQVVVPFTEKLILKETYSPGIIGKILLCFSVYTNGAKILDATPPKGHLGCVHGIRFLSMTWVILGHTYAFGYTFFNNSLEGLKLVNRWTFEVILQGTFSVDTFFLLSGLLVTYLFLKEISKGRKINWIYFYTHRFWRLTPPFMLLLAFDAVLWKHLGSGPFWPEEGMEGTKCSKYWWRNLLYINNMWNATEMCMGWTWYLANDMQFYVISPLFLAFFNSHSLISLIIVGVLMITSWTSTGVLSSIHEITAGINLDKDVDMTLLQRMQNTSFNIIYVKPWCRIGPYLVGVIVGFLIYQAGKRRNFLKKWIVLFCWLVAAGLCLSVIYGTYHVDLSVSTSAAYNSLSRSAWAVGVGWVIFACVTGHGGFVDTLLSWRLWIPLGRLTYCAYLIHPMVIYWYYLSNKTTIYFTHVVMVVYFLAFTVVSYCLALVASLAFESPMMALEKLVLRRNSN